MQSTQKMTGLRMILPILARYILLKRMSTFKTNVESHYDIMRQVTPLRGRFLDIPQSKYGGRYTVTMLPGSGTGPELMDHVKDVLKFAGAPIDFEEIQVDSQNESDEELKNAITSIKRNRVALKGNIETSSLKAGVLSPNVAIRNELDLYINVLNCKSYPGVQTRHEGIDIVVMRQNTEDVYSMLEHESVKGVVETLKVITRANSERVARYAFEYAKINGRKKVSVVHKANIMKITDGLFMQVVGEVSKFYPEIKYTNYIIDNCCMQLVSNPCQFDVLVTVNLYGTIVSNVICGLLGGPGLVSGRNYGDYYAVFETGTRNIAATLAGKNIVNPVAMLNASVDMLKHLGCWYHAAVIETAIEKTLNEDRVHTPDLCGNATSKDVVDNIKKHIESQMGVSSWSEAHIINTVQKLTKPEGDTK